MANQAMNEQGEYSLQWFKDRARTTLARIEENTWDFSDSVLLYAPGGDEEYETMQNVDTGYYTMITKPERAYLERIASDVVTELPQCFDFVDLGPGTAHKEQFIFDAAKQQNKRFAYIPVDISNHFLKLSSDYASKQGIEVRSEQVPFEELAEKLGPTTTPRFVSLGLTYSNYRPSHILSMLKEITGKGGAFFINVHIRDRVDMHKLNKVYGEDVNSISFSKLELFGLNAETDIENLETDDGIRFWCTLKKSTSELEARGLMSGGRVLLFQSLRYTKEELVKDLEANGSEYKMFDSGDAFIGVLVKT